ncbi:class I adenylate-forming enzyme family protein [Pseudonocardia halophobica]|uniref:AMP-dependent synthetase n=1 Tax=Pseudonocardia halophobica TaxID=29401 RepID=A0A9W6L536_9PSEU|nr:AMP-binding protein [Pseudonocardia halophobica]GLL13403.1 AMP-dependent synthetase [Pseudonocardia halophobica]
MPDTTVPDLLERRAVDAPEQGVVFPDGRETYPELARSTRRLSAALWALGLRPGDSVGLLLHGCLDSYRLWLAAARIGAVTVPLNPRLKPRELSYMIENADLRLLISTAGFAPVLHEALPGLAEGTPGRLALDAAPLLRAVVALDEPGPGFLHGLDESADPAGADEARGALRASDPILMLYTSGTTSRPRGCVHDHASLVAEGGAVAERLGLRPDDRFWAPLPMFHCGGFDVAIAALAGRCGMVHVGTFEPGRALDQLERERCTIGFPAFETIWVPVLEHPRFPEADLSALRLVINVGAPERMRAMQARLPQAVQTSCLGMTESFGFCCMGSPDDPAEVRATTSGVPLRHMEAKVVDPGTGEAVPPGVPGEFRFRGASRLVRYHRDPGTTAARIDADGWFASGDLVVADEAGRLRFVSRLKDMLKVGGENVAAAEVEGFLCEHPAVGLVQVVGAPDARYGEVAAAFVQLKAGATATEEELIAFCLGRIATFKVPRYVRFVDEFPMSGTKVQKFRLKERLADELKAAGITEAPVLSSRPRAS